MFKPAVLRIFVFKSILLTLCLTQNAFAMSERPLLVEIPENNNVYFAKPQTVTLHEKSDYGKSSHINIKVAFESVPISSFETSNFAKLKTDKVDFVSEDIHIKHYDLGIPRVLYGSHAGKKFKGFSPVRLHQRKHGEWVIPIAITIYDSDFLEPDKVFRELLAIKPSALDWNRNVARHEFSNQNVDISFQFKRYHIYPDQLKKISKERTKVEKHFEKIAHQQEKKVIFMPELRELLFPETIK